MKIFNVKLKIVAILLFSFSFFTGNGQTYLYQGDGTYQFQSQFPAWHLHFWLFDDGYHSFEKSPVHQYEKDNVPYFPRLHHAADYDDTDVDDLPVGLISEGYPDPDPVVLGFQNQIEIKSSWNLVNKNDNYYLVMFENTQSLSPISGCVEFHYNINDLDIVPEDILDEYANEWVGEISEGTSNYEGYTHKFQWPYQNLKAGEQRFIYIPANCLRKPLEKVFTRGVLKVNECNTFFPTSGKTDGAVPGIFNSPVYTYRSIVSTNPHDPNLITSDPDCVNAETPLTQTVRYKLKFQNEGDSPTTDVLVDFYSNVRFESVELIKSSFGCSLHWDMDQIHVEFKEIYLKGLGQEDPVPKYEETIGWVEIDVCYDLASIEFTFDDCVELEGQVFFEGQHPVIAKNEICSGHCNINDILDLQPCPVTPAHQSNTNAYFGLKTATDVVDIQEEDFDLFPNPANNRIWLKGTNIENKTKISVVNILGETVLDFEYVEDRDNEFDISTLSPGAYFMKIGNGAERKSKMFIKM